MSAAGKCPNCDWPFQGEPITCAECGEVLSTIPIMQVAADLAAPPMTPEQAALHARALAETREAYAKAKEAAQTDGPLKPVDGSGNDG